MLDCEEILGSWPITTAARGVHSGVLGACEVQSRCVLPDSNYIQS